MNNFCNLLLVSSEVPVIKESDNDSNYIVATYIVAGVFITCAFCLPFIKHLKMILFKKK